MIDRLFMGDRAQRFWGTSAGQLTFAAMVLAGAAALTATAWLIAHAVSR